MPDKEVTFELASKLGLNKEEFERIPKVLNRKPNHLEINIFSAMWSEHASYKNSLKWLKTLPTSGDKTLVKAGAENAGAIAINDDLVCVFKIQSHNHPCAIDPYNSSSTAVGGINRDIYAMGARPVAQLNSLRFGDPNIEKTKYYVKEIVKGIADFGNCLGVPMVGGETSFDESYNDNPLVNIMSVGLVKKDELVSMAAKGEGNLIFIAGAPTGNDGIHGVLFVSSDITEDSKSKMPPKQPSDSILEKKLLEATLEITNKKLAVSIHDIDSAGMACSLIEMAAKGKVGMEVELSKVPVQNKKLKPLEILLSETQQRIVMVVEKDNEKEVDKIFKKWDIKASQIGTITKEDQIIFKFKDEIVAELPPQALVSGIGAPVYDRQYSEPDYVLTSKNFSINDLPEPENLKEVAWSLIKNPNISSKQWIIQQFDSTIGSNNLSSNFPSDAAIINIKDTNLALVLNLDCNGRYVKADPAQGAAIAVADASRNIICAGGIPIAVTNCLNFGNPYNPEVFWQFVESINGLGEACRKFNIPVTGGKVSFYNQLTIKDKEFPILPTPVIGMIGLITDKNDQMTKSFKSKGDMIFLIGETRNDIYSSEYLVSYHKVKNSPPPFFDLDFEFKLQETVRGLIQHRFIRSAHDISEGGLFITLLESGMPNELGFDVTTDSEIRTDAFMFGESQGRIVVSVTPHKEAEFIDYMIESGIPTLMLGHVTKGEMRVDEVSFGFVKDAKKAYDGALENIISK